MSRLVLPALLAVALLSGCASFESSIPQDYVGPTANVSDSGAVQSTRLVHIFELTRVDGRALRGSHLATLSANYGRGFYQEPVILKNDVPARDLAVSIEASTVYAAPILAMTNPTCTVKGDVRLKAESGQQYRVTGKLDSEQCAVWIENAQTHEIVTEKVTARGTQ